MGQIIFGKVGKIFCSLVIIIYAFGAMVTKSIITGKTLQNVFHDVNVLNSYYFWLGLFFLSSSLFSFGNIHNTKPIQYIIIIFRFISISLMIIGSIIIMIKF